MPLYVTDTHPLLWYSTGTHRKLSSRALRVFKKASQGEALVWIPAMALWEAGLLGHIGRIQFKPSFEEWTDALISQPGFAFAPLDSEIITAVAFQANTDIFDTAIVATAQAKDLPLITRDEVIVRSRIVDVVW